MRWCRSALRVKITRRAAGPSWKSASRISAAHDRMLPAGQMIGREKAKSRGSSGGRKGEGESGIGRIAWTDQALRRSCRGGQYLAHHCAWAARMPARTLWLRQDDDAAADRRFRRAERGRDSRRLAPDLLSGPDGAA